VGFSLLSLAMLERQLRTAADAPLVVDARGREAYCAGHVPGALHIGWEDWCEPAPTHVGPVLRQAGYWGVLEDRDRGRLAARLGDTGLRHDQPIVVYDEGPRSWGRAGRVAWMLLYLGAHDVALLDATWNHWLAVGHPIEMGEPSPPRGAFVVSLRAARRLPHAQLAAAYRDGCGPLLLDTRRPEDFNGWREPYLPRRGHIPGAHLLPFFALYDADDRFVGREDYLALLPPAARDAAQLATYCEVGVRASTVALLHEHHTGRVVSVYDGSLMAWGLAHDLPVEGPNRDTPSRLG
jgi:thiosulfate/3-mercaptopyruvate sulfurtransferase